MEKKKIVVSLFLVAVLAVGVFFGSKKLNSSKNKVSILNESITIEPDQPLEAAVEPMVENQAEKKAVTEQPVVDENKEAVTTSQEEKKVVEQQKPVADTSDVKADAAKSSKLVSKLVSWGFAKSSDRKIDTVIVHTSYNSLGGDVHDADKIIDIYKQYQVSAHYLVLRDGTIYQLVSDQNISWHAGVSEMPDGRKNVNDFSIGIEVINTKDGKFTDDQYTALNSLVAGLKKKYPIKYVLGHDEIAPGRKTDPWGIDWKKVSR